MGAGSVMVDLLVSSSEGRPPSVAQNHHGARHISFSSPCFGVEDAPQNDRPDKNVKSCSRQRPSPSQRTGKKEKKNRQGKTWDVALDRRAPRGGANRDKTSMPKSQSVKRGGPQIVGRPAAFVSRSLGFCSSRYIHLDCLLVVCSETSRRPPESDGLPAGESVCPVLLVSTLCWLGEMP